MGGKTITTAEKKIASIQIQTSSYGLAIPVIYGTQRVAANLLWFGSFEPIAHTEKTSSGGKGIGKVTSKNTTYTYTAAAIMGVCEGAIAGVGAVWKDKDKTTLAALGLTVFTGTPTQSVWSFLSGYNVSGNWPREQAYGYAGQSAAFTDQAINYSGTAYLAASAYDLGSDAAIPNHSFEVQGLSIYGSGIVDANPAAIIPDMLSAARYGIGFPSAQIDALSSYSTYCRAAGLFMSPAYTEQRPAADCIKELCDATNAAPIWSGGLLKIIPYGDAALTGNGATYTPDLTPLFDLTEDDFLGTEEPVKVTRATPADAVNRVQIEFNNRANQYNAEVVTAEDQDAIERYGLKSAPVVQMPMICEAGTARFVTQLLLQRSLYKRNQYEFPLNARYAMLEPMDIVTLTDSGQAMNKLPVRLLSIEEQDHGFRCTAEDLPIGVASAARYTHDNGLRWQSIINTQPLDCAAPIIFEMPADPTATGLAVAIAVGGQTSDKLYGGCRVWLSLDGTNYKAAGIIYGSSRYGLTTASLAAHAAGADTTSTLSVALRSNGQMDSGSAADVAKGTTLINVGGEYLAYQTATLTGTNAYNLTTLNRGLYGTTPGTKASGSAWVRVDDALAVLKDLDLTLIGQTIYIKLTAFNTYAAGEQDLASVSPYTYTITGNMKALETPVDFATEVGGAEKPDNEATRNNFRGYWSSIVTNYVAGDVVVAAAGTYIAKSAVPTNTPPPDAAYWDLYVQTYNPRGTYNGSTAYVPYDVVNYLGGSYVAKVDTTGNAPSGTDQDNAYWSVFAAPGAVGAPATPPSAFSATINLPSSSGANLRSLAEAAGYTGMSDATITFKVPNGVTVRGLAGAPGGYGIDSGTWPSSSYAIALTLVVESGGIVDGGGGNGNGGLGGDAIYLRESFSGGITVNSGGTVRGGGGGGGRGGNFSSGGSPDNRITVGGGGGGGGAPNGASGVGSPATKDSGTNVGTQPSNGSGGTTGGGGAPGSGGAYSGVATGGTGGAGGTFAATGSTGSNATTNGPAGVNGAAGGVGGYAVRKNGKTATVTNNGTLTGSAA